MTVPENYTIENGKLMFDAHEAQKNKRKYKSKESKSRNKQTPKGGSQ